MSNFNFAPGSKEKLYGDGTHKGVHTKVAELCEKALEYSTVDFSITYGRRTEEEQKELYSKGRTELDGVNKKSDHQLGIAVDVLPYLRIDGKKLDMYNTEDKEVARCWLEVYRAFMRAAFKLHLVIEFGLCYNISGGRDWPHVSVKGVAPTTNPLLEDE